MAKGRAEARDRQPAGWRPSPFYGRQPGFFKEENHWLVFDVVFAKFRAGYSAGGRFCP